MEVKRQNSVEKQVLLQTVSSMLFILTANPHLILMDQFPLISHRSRSQLPVLSIPLLF